jgi:hypothetical protein
MQIDDWPSGGTDQIPATLEEKPKKKGLRFEWILR